MKIARTIVLILLMLAPGHAIGGSIGYTQISSYMDWEPDCSKPWEPSFYAHDLHSYNMAVDSFNSYLAEVESYILCIQSEGEDDLRTIANAISNSLDELRSEISYEVDAARSNLETQKLFLD